MKSLLSILLCFFSLSLSAQYPTNSGVLFLKDGSLLHGKITKITNDGYVLLKNKFGDLISFKNFEINKFVEKKSPKKVYRDFILRKPIPMVMDVRKKHKKAKVKQKKAADSIAKNVQLSGIYLNDGTFLFGEVQHRYSNGRYFIQLINGRELFLDASAVDAVNKLNKTHFISDKHLRSIIVKGRYNILRFNSFFSLRSKDCCPFGYSLSKYAYGLVFISGYQWSENFGMGIGIGRHAYPILTERVFLNTGLDYSYLRRKVFFTVFPVFFDIRGLFKKPRSFAGMSYSVQIGYEIPIQKKIMIESYDYNNSYFKYRVMHNGFFIHPSIGYRIPTSQVYNYELELGYVLFWLKVTDENQLATAPTEVSNKLLFEHGLTVSFGIVF